MDNHSARVRQHLAHEREVGRAPLPERRDKPIDHAMREQASHDAGLALHRVEVADAVAAADGHAGDEVVHDELVQDDQAGLGAQRLEDPAVRLRAVADVEDAELGRPAPARAAPGWDDHLDVQPIGERG